MRDSVLELRGHLLDPLAEHELPLGLADDPPHTRTAAESRLPITTRTITLVFSGSGAAAPQERTLADNGAVDARAGVDAGRAGPQAVT